MPLSADTQAALARSAAALRGEAPTPAADDDRDADAPLRWTDTGWTRRAARPHEADPPVDLMGNEIAERMPAAGWDVTHTRHIDRAGFPRSGIVFDTDDERIDAETGEHAPAQLHAAGLVLSDRGGVTDVAHMVLAWPDDVDSASPPRRSHIAEVVTAAARLAARKSNASRRAWLLSIASRLEGVS